MRTVDEHRAALLALVAALPPVTVPLSEALGRLLAADVVAAVDLPGFDNSAMDGYAVRSADVAGASAASPVVLDVDGDIAAGDTRRHVLRPGVAMRIMTGAPLPEGADAIVPVEASDGGVSRVALTLAAEVGRHLRSQGEDVHVGDVVLRGGTRLGPGQVALAAASNVAVVTVAPRPRVTILSTGDELVPPGTPLEHGQIVDSNSVMLAALVSAAGAEVVGRSPLDDDAEAMASLLRDVPGQPDLVLTTGGVSMGAYDTVKEVLSDTGTVDFVKVAMRPGMPQGAGVVGEQRTPIITLPGNPVSSFVSFHVFVLPVLRALAGLDPEVATTEAMAAEGWSSIGGKVEFTRVVLGADGARPSGGQGSHMLGALAEATHLAVVDAETTQIRPGDTVQLVSLVGENLPRGHR
ncbi:MULTISPECIES: gephyrin-like molybdotransferase Glp [unclassified Knoellia]|uniref:molybdopterin molybdotransferase MoeA n=1 Tax=Knoellia altitudinis TaxID=3404795 RepID=UPI0036072333